MVQRQARLVLAAALIMFADMFTAFAAGPVETNVFAVQGVEVDVTASDASTAKNEALVQVQMKAFVMLAERLGNETLAAEMAKLKQEDVLPLLKSLSIESESTGPGRYIGKFTVRFLPTKIYNLFAGYGVNVVAEQARPMLVIPLWKTAEGTEVWGDNPWRQAWIDLHAEQSVVPIVIPLGDLEDSSAVTLEDVLEMAPVKIEALRRRYGVQTILLAEAEPTEGNGIHARMTGNSELGRITFDKVYTAEPAALEASASLAVKRFHGVMVDKYKSDKQKAVAGAGTEEYGMGPTTQSIPVNVPFSSPSEWNRLRSRILSAPGVIGVDVSTLAGDGAVIRLMFEGDLAEMQASIQAIGLELSQNGSGWTIQPLS